MRCVEISFLAVVFVRYLWGLCMGSACSLCGKCMILREHCGNIKLRFIDLDKITMFAVTSAIVLGISSGSASVTSAGIISQLCRW